MSDNTPIPLPDLYSRWRTGELDQTITTCTVHKLAAAMQWPTLPRPRLISRVILPIADVHRLAVLAAYEAGKREAMAQFAGRCSAAPAWASGVLRASAAEAWELAVLAAKAMDTRALEMAVDTRPLKVA
jgi:hypothetical protein